MNQRDQDLLFDLLYQPTAPFRELHVAKFVADKLRRAHVPYFFDPSGNIVIGVGSAGEYKKLLNRSEREPVRLFVAHMDHPGFHGVRWLSDSEIEVAWHGGAPVKGLNNAPMWLADQNGYAAVGNITRSRLDKTRKRLLNARVKIGRKNWPLRPPAQTLFGGFGGRAPVWRERELIYTKAADDLVGVFAIVRMALTLFRGGRRRPPFVGLLTRAEEVGFIGMLAHLEQRWLQQAKRRVIYVSLETSRALPGAEIGKGPVVRLGDRRTVFDAGYLRVLTDIAEKVLPKQHQRRIMDGGTCEATAALAYGLPAIGVSVPLGNYHNESYEGRTRGRPAPEYVHRGDVAGLLELCAGLMQPGLPWHAPWANTRDALKKNFQQQRRRLGQSKR